MNRRRFLHSAAGAFALPTLARSAESSGPSLGFSLYG